MNTAFSAALNAPSEASLKYLSEVGSVGRASGVWTGFIQNVLVALAVFLFTQLWARKENHQRIREALFDMKSEIVHNSALIEDADRNLELMPSLDIEPGYQYVPDLQTQSLQRNLVLLAQQDEKYSDNLVQYYSFVDSLKDVAEKNLTGIAETDQLIQQSESILQIQITRRDNFMINEDKIDKRYPSLLNDTTRSVQAISRTIDQLNRNKLKMQENIRTIFRSDLKVASADAKLALASIAVMNVQLDLRDDRLYVYMGYLLAVFLFTAFVPLALRTDKKKALMKNGAKAKEIVREDNASEI